MTTQLEQAARLALEALEGLYESGALDRITKALAALRSALSDAALERKAENARELGLDYEPAQSTAGKCKLETVPAKGGLLPAHQPIRCEHRLKNNGVCPHHNLQCGWPKCNEPKQPAQGCDYCNHPQYAGIKCKNCGLMTEQSAQDEPVSLKKGECWPEYVMQEWDYWRKQIADGDKGSAPRDWFEELAELKLVSARPQAREPEQPAQDEPKREWVGLTDEELRQIVSGWEWDCMKAVEAKLKEKNT